MKDLTATAGQSQKSKRIPDYNRGFKRQDKRTQDKLRNIHTTFQVKLSNRD